MGDDWTWPLADDVDPNKHLSKMRAERDRLVSENHKLAARIQELTAGSPVRVMGDGLATKEIARLRAENAILLDIVRKYDPGCVFLELFPEDNRTP